MRALSSLSIPGTSLVASFFMQYRGGFYSPKFGHELLDLVDGAENVLQMTDDCRTLHGLETRFVAITTMVGLSIYIYDIVTDEVFDVDFEGGVELLVERQLSPKWRTFSEFLVAYFC
jgi:hypothetical protein